MPYIKLQQYKIKKTEIMSRQPNVIGNIKRGATNRTKSNLCTTLAFDQPQQNKQ